MHCEKGKSKKKKKSRENTYVLSHAIYDGYLLLSQIRPYVSSIRTKAVVSSVSLATSRMSVPVLGDGSCSRTRNVCLLVRTVHFFKEV